MSTTTPTDSIGSNEHKAAPIQVRPRFRRILIVGGAVLAIALVVGFIPQLRQRQTAVADTKQLAIPTVAVVSPTVTTPGSGLNLPAEVKPWQEASIFARVNGYLKDWLVDIGAHVEKDQLLADIDTPDLDQQLAQANSQAVLAKRNLDQAKSTNTKWQELYKQGVVSQLDAENQATSQGTNQANTEAFAANLRFLEQEVAFKRVTAPFPGIITIRNVNVGDLITANNTNLEMFHIQQTDPLRVYFRVPQEDASNIAAGQTFDVQVGAQSAKTYPGKVISTSGAVSPDSRTMLVELQVDNSKNEILPGSYATVRVPQVALGKLVTLPDNTLIFRDKSVQVGVVDAKGVVQLRDVKVGRDFGVQSEILSGVTQSDKVIVNPSDSLTTGTTVRLAATPGPSAMPAGSAKSDASAAPTASVTAAPSAAPAVSAAPTASTTSGSSATPVPSATPIPSPTQR
ncbi:MAG: efflux RND transporter periplasmic adaptor subunit [Acidobacteria bacterium]|nr:MAG: efflux RND transporter periplasmic adaptor subunit [Acidobacteriota bacterium]